MTTDKDLEDLLRQVRLSTTAEQDERILGDALAAIDRPAVFSLRTLARSLRRHRRLSTAAACVLVFLVVLPLALPRTPVEDSPRVREVAAVTESPENPAPPTLGTEGGNTTHDVAALTESPENPAAPTRGIEGGNTLSKTLELAGQPKTLAGRNRAVLRKESTTPNAPGLARQTQSPTGAVVLGDKSGDFGTRAAALRNRSFALQVRLEASGSEAGLPGALDAEQTVAKSPLIYKLRLTQVLEDLQGKVFSHKDTADREILLEAKVLRVLKGDPKAAGQRVVLVWDTLRGGPHLESCLNAEYVLPKHATSGEAFYLMALTPAEPATDAEGRPRLKNVFSPDIRGTRVSKADVDPQQWATAKKPLERLKLELLSALDDADGNTRHGAIKGLRRWDGQKLSEEPPGGPLWKDEPAAARILAASTDPDWRVRWVVAWMIPKEAGQEGEKALVRLLSDTHRDVRQVAESVLRRRGQEAAGTKPDDQTPVAEAAWGQAVEGVQVRLRAKQSTWNEGEVPRLWADVRNQGKRNLLVTTQSNRCELEVDGRWYRRPIYTREIRLLPRPFPPGRQYDDIAVNVDQWWELPASENARAPWKTGPERLKLTPGKHTIRVAFTATAAKNAPGKPFRAVSNPVEIEIVAKSDEKVDATQQDDASVTAAEPTVEATGAKPDDQTPAGASGFDRVGKPRFASEGRVVDDVTGKPVEHFAVQNGSLKVGAPTEIMWITVLQSRVGIRGGRFHVANDWFHEGAVRQIRIVADGYLPEVAAVDTEDGVPGAPLVIRLRRGEAIRGRVVDHAGTPVAGAKVFLGGPERFAEIRDGRTEHRSRVRKETDAHGRFVLHGAAKENLDQIVVLAPSLPVWTVPVQAPEPGKELTVKLPQPATLVIRYGIEGDEPIGQFRLELKTWEMPGWKGVVRSVQNPTAKNQGEVVLKNMTPGVYDVIRSKSLRFGIGGREAFCDRCDVTLKPGKTTTIEFVRKRGHPIDGELVGLEHTLVPGAYVYVRPPEATGDPEARDEWRLPIFDGVACVRGGKFKTALIEPGQYKIVAHAFEPEPPGVGFNTAWRLPAYVGTAMVRVPEDGPPPPVRIEMKPRAARRKTPSVTAPPKPAAKPTVEAASSNRVIDVEPDGKEILEKLKSIDAVYAAAFTASGTRPGWPRRKWKFTMFRGRIALEEEVVEIPKPTETTKTSHYGPTQKGRFIAMRSTFYVGPTAQAKYDWVGRIPRYGPLDPRPENSPGLATNGSLDVDDPDAPTYMLSATSAGPLS